MEVVGQYPIQAAVFKFSIRLLWFMSMALSVFAVITIIIVGIVIAGHRELSNPFSAYHDLFGDDAEQAASERGFTCQNNSSQITYRYCVQDHPTKLFSRLSVRMSDGAVSE